MAYPSLERAGDARLEIAPRIAIGRHGARRFEQGRIGLLVTEIAAGDEAADIEALGVPSAVLSARGCGDDLGASSLKLRARVLLRPRIGRRRDQRGAQATAPAARASTAPVSAHSRATPAPARASLQRRPRR